jgi:hypothetical protein
MKSAVKEKMARVAIAALRCSACDRSPNEKEQQAMFDNFGHTLLVKPLRRGERMIWNCNHCFQAGPSN